MVSTCKIWMSTCRGSFSFSGMSSIPALVVIFVAVVGSSISMSDASRRPSTYRLVPSTSSSSSSSKGRSKPVATSAVSSGGCEPVRLPLCRSTMPYSRTRLPNLLDHATQHNARLVFDQYQMLIKTGCGVMPFGDNGDVNGASRTSSASVGEDALAFYLCAVFAPICPTGFEQAVSSANSLNGNGDERSRRPERHYQHPVSGRRRTRYGSGSGALSGMAGIGGQLIPPCRGVCERARAGCEPVMRRYNVSWPDELDCARWPTKDRGVCISPESIDWRRRTREERVPGR